MKNEELAGTRRWMRRWWRMRSWQAGGGGCIRGGEGELGEYGMHVVTDLVNATEVAVEAGKLGKG